MASTEKIHLKFLLAGVVMIMPALVHSVMAESGEGRVEHPYREVDWEAYGQHKANLHTHTTRSDGKVDPGGVVDMYHDHGYTILSLTDHDTKNVEATTWPWQDFERDPGELGMIAIEGNEISRVHHINSFYSDYGDADVSSEEEVFLQIGERGGLAHFNHPGRYTGSEKPEQRRTVGWYCDLFRRHPHILGMEVYNQRDKYPGDRKTWDAILTELLPERLVWGFANDDMHVPETNFGYSWNIVLLPELTDATVREALSAGRFFFAHSPEGRNSPPVPVIEKITVDEQSGTIRLRASGFESIEWIAEGEVVHHGAELDLAKTSGKRYVRAMVYGPGGTVVGTQPFVLAGSGR